MAANQCEGSSPNLAGTKVGAKVSSGTATPKLRKTGISPSPSDKGNSGRGKG